MTREDSAPFPRSPGSAGATPAPPGSDAALDDQRRRAALEREVRELRARLEEAQAAVRARDELLSIVTHDLGSPLTAIVVTVGLLDRHDEAAARGLDVILRCTERMARLLGDLVDVVARDAGRPTLRRAPSAPGDVVGAVAEMFAPLAAERGQQFRVEVADGLPAVDCDRDRVVQALCNLVGNAIKVTRRGGSVVLGAERVDDDLCFFVADTGPGIDGEDLPRVFDRLWRGEHVGYGGRGLGLWIARVIADAHGARLGVDSARGRGARFTFSLPLRGA